MNHRFHFIAAIVILACSATLYADEDGLFPKPRDYKNGYLEVDDLHKIFYVCCGNPEGKPVMAIHGGPGTGAYPRMAQYFNPEKYNIVLHDQRGAQNSKPQGELKGNNTQNLVEDIEKLRKHLGLGKVLIAGGSWGTALGLAYAETYPENVTGLILRGVFLSDEAEILFHYMGTANFFPEEHAALLAVLPDETRGTHPDYIYELVTGEDLALRDVVLDKLFRFEMKFMKLHVSDERVDNIINSFSKEEAQRAAMIDLTYVTNRHFLKEGQLLNNIGRINHLPAVIIHGRYDMATCPASAYKVHKAMPKSKLVIVEKAGHSETEEGITSALLEAAAGFEQL